MKTKREPRIESKKSTKTKRLNKGKGQTKGKAKAAKAAKLKVNLLLTFKGNNVNAKATTLDPSKDARYTKLGKRVFIRDYDEDGEPIGQIADIVIKSPTFTKGVAKIDFCESSNGVQAVIVTEGESKADANSDLDDWLASGKVPNKALYPQDGEETFTVEVPYNLTK